VEFTLTHLEGFGGCESASLNLLRFNKARVSIALGNDYTPPPKNRSIFFNMGMPMHEIQLMSRAGLASMRIILTGTHNTAHVGGTDIHSARAWSNAFRITPLDIGGYQLGGWFDRIV
jgi:hypothetical protein